MIHSSDNQRLIFGAPARRYFRLSRGPALSGRSTGMTANRGARRLGRLLADSTNAQFSTHHTHLLQFLEYLLRHAFRQVHVAMIFANIDTPYVHTLNARLVGNGTNNVAWLDPMY